MSVAKPERDWNHSSGTLQVSKGSLETQDIAMEGQRMGRSQ